MDMHNSDKETRGDDSAESDPKETDVQDDVGPDVGTSLGQPDKAAGDTNVAEEKDSSFETAPGKDVHSDNSIENSQAEESGGSEGDSGRDEEDKDTGVKESEKDVLDVDELDLDDVPLVQTMGDSVAKRLRSNKGKVVPSASKNSKKTTTAVTETPKCRTKSAGVGPKKSWSKVAVKTTAGSSRKRKVVSSSESDYDVEENVLNIIPSNVKKSTGKKTVQIVENVPIDKVSIHLHEFAQRWKYIYHRRLAVER
jgi:hypothetical protein